MGFKVKPCLVCRGFGVPSFDVFCKNACVGDGHFANDYELGVCFGGALVLFHRGVLADGVDDIVNRISVDVDMVGFILSVFIEALIGYFSVVAKDKSRGV